MTEIAKLVQPTAVQKDQIYEVLLPFMLEVAEIYIDTARGNRIMRNKSQITALQDIWKTLTSVADQHTLQELVERLEAVEKGENVVDTQ